MRSSKIIALLTAIAAAFSLVSCSMPDKDSSDSKQPTTAASTTKNKNNKKQKASEPSESAESVTLDEVREHVNETLDDIKVTGNSEKVSADIDTLIYDIDVCSDICARKEIAYYLEFNNSDLEAAYDESYEQLYIAYQLVTYAIAHCNKKDEYKSIVAGHINDEELIEAYADPAMTMKRLEGYSKVDFELLDERTDEYYDLSMNDELDDDEKALKCAELYLDLLLQYDTESFYDNYNRDYSPELAIELCDTAYKKLRPSMDKIREAFLNDSEAENVIDDPTDFEDPFGTLQKYAAKLSPDIKKAADKLMSDKLWYLTDDEDAFPGCFTTSYPLTGDSVIFINKNRGSSVLTSSIHEFGHFYASYYDNTSSYDCINNLDISEVQSQGMEFIFMRYYDKLFGEQANAMKLYQTYSMLDSIISGFLVGKFEYTVLSKRDELTPQGVLDCWDEIMGDYTNMEFYEINHLFEAPGYYVSYAVSALAAFDIWEDCLYDPDSALEKYEKIAKIPANSPDTKFQAALKSCGFSDVMTKEYINVIAEEISDYAEDCMDR